MGLLPLALLLHLQGGNTGANPAPGNPALACQSGSQTPGNSPLDDNSTTSVTVTVPLPLDLLSFSGINKNCSAIISWTTANENNFSHFEIESSTDGRTFKKIADVKGGIMAYEYVSQPHPGTTYYRLKMTDKDRSYSYSNIISINNNCDAEKISVFPSVTKSYFNLTGIHSEKSVLVKDAYGNIQLMQKVQDTKDQVDISRLAPGMYFITILGQDGAVTANEKINKI